MSSHTHSLSVLVLLLRRVPGAAVPGGAGDGGRRPVVPTGRRVVVTGAAGGVRAGRGAAVVRRPGHRPHPAAGAGGGCCRRWPPGLAAPVLELAATYAAARVRGRRVSGVRLHQGWTARGGLALVGALVAGVAEEAIFRGVGLYLLVHPLAVPVVAAVAVTAVGYGLNHLYFGWSTVAQKTLTGVAVRSAVCRQRLQSARAGRRPLVQNLRGARPCCRAGRRRRPRPGPRHRRGCRRDRGGVAVRGSGHCGRRAVAGGLPGAAARPRTRQRVRLAVSSLVGLPPGTCSRSWAPSSTWSTGLAAIAAVSLLGPVPLGPVLAWRVSLPEWR